VNEARENFDKIHLVTFEWHQVIMSHTPGRQVNKMLIYTFSQFTIYTVAAVF